MRNLPVLLVFFVLLCLCVTACSQTTTAETNATPAYADATSPDPESNVVEGNQAQTPLFAEMSNETCYATLTEWGFPFGADIDAAAAEGNYDGVEYYRTMAATIEQDPGYVYAVTFRSLQPYRNDPLIAVMNNLLYEKLNLSFTQAYTQDGVTHEIPVTATVDEETGALQLTAIDPADQAYVLTPGGSVFVK